MTTSIDNLFARDGFWWWVGVVVGQECVREGCGGVGSVV